MNKVVLIIVLVYLAYFALNIIYDLFLSGGRKTETDTGIASYGVDATIEESPKVIESIEQSSEAQAAIKKKS